MGWHLFRRKTVIPLLAFIIANAAIPGVTSATTISPGKNVSATEKSSVTSSSTAAYIKIDLEGTERKETEPYRTEFLKPFGQKKLKLILEEGENYRLYVRAKLKEFNMPSAIEYIPVIESEYKPSARSKDGKGVGMWQFMMNSIHPFLTVNEWIDERLDPWKETDAALKKLQDNYNFFGDWLLAIAAYNCGAGAMKRAIAAIEKKNAQVATTTPAQSTPGVATPSSPSTYAATTTPATSKPAKTKITFWDVAKTNLIPEHTKRYIPKLLAIADLCENTQYYKIDLPTAKDKNGRPVNPHSFLFDYIETDSQVALRILSSELRIDLKILEELNPSLLYGITPPEKGYKLRLPKGMKEAAQIYIKSNR